MALFGQNRPGGGSLGGGNASTGVNVNFQPAANYWDGDQFVIPGVTPGYAPGGQGGFTGNPQNRINRLQGRIDSGNLPPQILAMLQQRLAMLQGGGQPQAQAAPAQGQGFKSFAPYNLRPYGGLLG